jgi:hypothetical protein
MPAGIEIRRADGRLIMDTSDIGGLVAVLIQVPQGTGTTTQSLSALVGTTVQVVNNDGSAQQGVTISYPGGVPTVAVAQSSTEARNIMVMVE